MKKKLTKGIRLLLAIAVMCIIVFPVVWMLNISFFKQTDLFADVPKLAFLDGFSLEGYREVLSDLRVYQWLGNSILVSLVAVALSVALSLFAAYALSRFRSRLNNVLTVVIICT